jgi:hypothetical protein
MTLRGCVLGNSHLAALRFAAADCADLPSGVALDFIGSAQNGLADVALDGQKLRATSAATEADFQRFGNVSAVDLAAYDFFVLVGLGLNIYGLEPFYRSHRCYGMRHWHQETDTRMLVSRPVAQAILLGTADPQRRGSPGVPASPTQTGQSHAGPRRQISHLWQDAETGRGRKPLGAV